MMDRKLLIRKSLVRIFSKIKNKPSVYIANDFSKAYRPFGSLGFNRLNIPAVSNLKKCNPLKNSLYSINFVALIHSQRLSIDDAE